MSLTNSFIDYNCIEIYTIINKIIVSEICERLQIESYSLFKPKSLREYDDQLAKRPITHCLLPTLKIQNHKKKILSDFDYPIKTSWSDSRKVINE